MKSQRTFIADTSTTHEEIETEVHELLRQWGFRSFGVSPERRLRH